MKNVTFAAKTLFGRLGLAMLIFGTLTLTSCQEELIPQSPSSTHAADDPDDPDNPSAKPPKGGHGGGK
ncbi:hypothetical protein [Larkinella terrae]|uniref:Uncharacterized protein n=1 Tax=Larkinella terrae TaxID=2025311 RepID=A0A7K0EEQ0_9BACT|nr:hypothetical protein [Larkinella terrae]MRS60319.1 hypothetical protein [Larkinella terrae]